MVGSAESLAPIKIETYWNVNALAQHFEESEKSIKIETYWNVNDYMNNAVYLICD